MLILGSKSQRRKEILESMGIDFKIIIKDVEENIKCDDYLEYPKLTALKKALALINEVSNEDIILCCDTIVYAKGKILGKPNNLEEAYQMIKDIQDDYHYVVTGVFLGNKEKAYNLSVSTKVIVSAMNDEEILEYVKSPEPYDKAGGYAIQGLFGKFIEGIEGDYYNVVGLPINTINKLLKEFVRMKDEE